MSPLRALGLAHRFDSGLVADLPRILHPLRIGSIFQSYYVKTQVLELALTLLHPPQFRATCNAALFVGGNAFQCAAMAVVAAQAHLNNNRRVALRHDQVDFTAATAVVSGNQHQALRFQQVQCLYFSLLPLGKNGQFMFVRRSRS